MTRCTYVVQGSMGDRCRRVANHVDGSDLGQWHMPECGSAVNNAGEWIVSEQWMTLWESVVSHDGVTFP